MSSRGRWEASRKPWVQTWTPPSAVYRPHLVEEAGAEDAELPGQVVQILAVLSEVSSLELAQRVVNLELDILGEGLSSSSSSSSSSLSSPRAGVASVRRGGSDQTWLGGAPAAATCPAGAGWGTAPGSYHAQLNVNKKNM